MDIKGCKEELKKLYGQGLDKACAQIEEFLDKTEEFNNLCVVPHHRGIMVAWTFGKMEESIIFDGEFLEYSSEETYTDLAELMEDRDLGK